MSYRGGQDHSGFPVPTALAPTTAEPGAASSLATASPRGLWGAEQGISAFCVRRRTRAFAGVAYMRATPERVPPHGVTGGKVVLSTMSAKEKLLERAPQWSEEQAERALLAAEGGQSPEREPSGRGRRDLLMRAATLRAHQSREVDAAALIREARGELDQRAS